MALRIEHQNPPQEIFRSIAESAAHLYDNDNGGEDLVNELCREAGLASVSGFFWALSLCAIAVPNSAPFGLLQEYMEILGHDLRQRLQGEKGSAEKS